jgi:hypothetical protein
MGCRLACGLISDIANNCKIETWHQFLDTTVNALLQLLGDAFADTSAKFHAIVALGDVALAAEWQYFNTYIERVLSNLQTAAVASLKKGENEEEEESLRQLRTSLLDCYISVLHGLHQEDNQQ